MRLVLVCFLVLMQQADTPARCASSSTSGRDPQVNTNKRGGPPKKPVAKPAASASNADTGMARAGGSGGKKARRKHHRRYNKGSTSASINVNRRGGASVANANRKGGP
jgi:hypothetical protein